MSARTYPRVGSARRMDYAKGKCIVCGEPATRKVFVEVGIFRGNDEGPFKTCDLHTKDADEILNAHVADQQARSA